MGLLGTLIGVGGGFLLVPLLLLAYPGTPPAEITAISLAVTFLNALSGTAAYARQRRIHYRSGLLFAAACVPGAVLGAWCTYRVASRAFLGLFAAVLIGIALVLFLKPPRRGEDAGSPQFCLSRAGLWMGSGLSIGVGFLSSFLGIGGGILHVPILAGLLKFPVHVATATSQFILLFAAFTGTLTHVAGGAIQAGWPRIAALGAGAVLGAQAGARLSAGVRPALLMRILAAALLLASLRLAATAWDPDGGLFFWKPAAP